MCASSSLPLDGACGSASLRPMSEPTLRKPPFWQTKSLAEMTAAEWESLCDGCGRCCLLKLEDPDDGALAHTDIACHLLDLESCRCGNYARRCEFVPDCVQLSPANIGQLHFMPTTCAYRRLAEGRGLAWWPQIGRASCGGRVCRYV